MQKQPHTPTTTDNQRERETKEMFFAGGNVLTVWGCDDIS